MNFTLPQLCRVVGEDLAQKEFMITEGMLYHSRVPAASSYFLFMNFML